MAPNFFYLKRRFIRVSWVTLVFIWAAFSGPLNATREAAADPIMKLENLVHLDLRVGSRAFVRCHRGSDGISARVEISGSGAREAISNGNQVSIADYRIRFRRVYGLKERVVGRIYSPKGIVRCSPRLAKNRVHLFIGRVHAKERLIDFAQTLRKHTLPRSLITISTAGQRLDKLIEAGDDDAATKFLPKIIKAAALDDYLTLRRADLQVMMSKGPTAYVNYTTIASRRGRSGVAMLALLRAARLAWLSDKNIPDSHFPASVERLDGPYGTIARAELADLLVECGQAERALEVVDSGEPRLQAQYNRLVEAAMYRALFQGKNFDLARIFLDAEQKIGAHPRRTALRLVGARALLALGLPDYAISVLQQVLASVDNRDQQEEAVFLASEAYLAADHMFRARQVTDYYLATFILSHRREQILRQRAELRFLEGDQKGFLADIRHVSPAKRGSIATWLSTKRPNGAAQSKRHEEVARLEKRQPALVPMGLNSNADSARRPSSSSAKGAPQ